MSFFLYIFYVILTFLRPVEMFAPELGEYRPMLVIWAVAMGFALFEAVQKGRVAARPVHFLLLVALMAIIGVSQVAAGWSGGAITSVYDFSTAAMLFVLTCFNLTDPRRVRIACTTLAVCMVVVSIYSIAAYHQGFMADELMLRQNIDADGGGIDFDLENTIPAQDTSGDSLWRVRHMGFLNDPNDLAQTMVMVLPMLWGRWRRRRFFGNLFAIVAPSALMGYTIFLTHSRGAILGVGTVFLFGIARAFGAVKAMMLAGLAGVGALAVGLGGGRGFSTQETSANQRVEAWYEGFQMLKSNPVFGVGFGNFTDHHELTAHNSFVLCFAELGLPGFFVWMGLLVLAYQGLRQVVAFMPVGSEERRQGLILLASMAGYLVCAWFLSRTYSPGLFLLLAICVSAAWCARRGAATVSDVPWPRVRWIGLTLLAMFGSMAAVYGFIILDRMSGGG